MNLSYLSIVEKNENQPLNLVEKFYGVHEIITHNLIFEMLILNVNYSSSVFDGKKTWE
jgi:hypothetical protein